VVKELHNDRDFEEISELLSPASPYFIQSFTDSGHIIAPGFHACSREQLEHYLSLVLPRLPQARLRGID
jgi:pyruvate formate lyase activating enzyme